MGVERVILGANQLLGDGTTQQHTENAVANGVMLRLVKGQQNQGIVPEVGVVPQLLDETTLPHGRKRDVGVVAIVGHVRRDKRPLRERVVGNVIVQAGEVLDLAQPGGIAGDRVVQDQRVMLADIVVGTGLLVGIVEALEARKRHVLLVFRPRDALGVEQVDHRRDVLGDLPEVVIVHAKVIAARRTGVVGLGGVSDGPVVGQLNPLRRQVFLVGIAGGGAIVLSRRVSEHAIVGCEQTRPLTTFSSQIW